MHAYWHTYVLITSTLWPSFCYCSVNPGTRHGTALVPWLVVLFWVQCKCGIRQVPLYADSLKAYRNFSPAFVTGSNGSMFKEDTIVKRVRSDIHLRVVCLSKKSKTMDEVFHSTPMGRALWMLVQRKLLTIPLTHKSWTKTIFYMFVLLVFLTASQLLETATQLE